MDMQIKNMTIEKMDDSGTGLARLGTLSAVDHDGDTYAPGAFMWKGAEGQWASMLPAHNRSKMPFGKARVYEDGDVIYAALQLNLDTEAGREWHAALKFDLATGKPVQEWSYGYNAKEFTYEQKAGQRVRLLKKVEVHEVSPVLKAAGLGTGTMSIKHAALKEERFSALMADLAEMATVASSNPAALSANGAKQLSDIHAAIGGALTTLAAAKAAEDDAQNDDAEAAQHKALAENALAEFTRTTVRPFLKQ